VNSGFVTSALKLEWIASGVNNVIAYTITHPTEMAIVKNNNHAQLQTFLTL
jgi:hypothetical protein